MELSPSGFKNSVLLIELGFNAVVIFGNDAVFLGLNDPLVAEDSFDFIGSFPTEVVRLEALFMCSFKSINNLMFFCYCCSAVGEGYS